MAERSTATAVVVHLGNEPDSSIAGLELTGPHNPLTSAFFQQLITIHEHLQRAWDD